MDEAFIATVAALHKVYNVMDDSHGSTLSRKTISLEPLTMFTGKEPDYYIRKGNNPTQYIDNFISAHTNYGAVVTLHLISEHNHMQVPHPETDASQDLVGFHAYGLNRIEPYYNQDTGKMEDMLVLSNTYVANGAPQEIFISESYLNANPEIFDGAMSVPAWQVEHLNIQGQLLDSTKNVIQDTENRIIDDADPSITLNYDYSIAQNQQQNRTASVRM